MPEETPAVQNWRLLIVACVLGLVVMVVYNVHISKVRRGLDEVKITAFRFDRDIEAGETIKDEDLVRYQIRKSVAKSIGRLLGEDEKDSLAVGRKIRRDVSKDEFARMGHFTSQESTGAAGNLKKDEVQISIPVDSKRTVGRVLRIGNHVNILGMLPTKQGTYRMYRIIEWLKVEAIGGEINRQDTSGGGLSTADRGVRSYNSITVDIKRSEPDVSLQWANLQTYLRGPAVIEICPSRFIPPRGTAGIIAKDLMHFTTKAADASVGGFDDGS